MRSRELEKTQNDVSENWLSQSSGSYELAKKQSACSLLGLLLDPAGDGSMFLRNVGMLQPHYTGNIRVIFKVLFIYSSFNDAVSSADYIASNGGVVTNGRDRAQTWMLSSYHYNVCLERLNKIAKIIFQNSRCLGRDSNRDPLKTVRNVTTQPSLQSSSQHSRQNNMPSVDCSPCSYWLSHNSAPTPTYTHVTVDELTLLHWSSCEDISYLNIIKCDERRVFKFIIKQWEGGKKQKLFIHDPTFWFIKI
jgi:hypothetical protein